MTTVKVFAPAKVNLTLHITGQRDDGYHLIDSLVSFATVGDHLTFQTADQWALTVDGSEALGVPNDCSNLAIRAAQLVCDGGILHLEKNLPAASGIGGGSADAAAALRAALVINPGHSELDWNAPPVGMVLPLAEKVLSLGADIPMCLLSQPARVCGIGEAISFVELPRLPVLLINPRVPVPTPSVFQGLAARNNLPMPEMPEELTQTSLVDWLWNQRNDLEAPALEIAPVIRTVLEALRASENCQLARMSGSGATCFGIFDTLDAAQTASDLIHQAYPSWWLAVGYLGDQSEAATPLTIS